MNGNMNGSSGSTSAQVVLGSMERAEEYGSILTTLKANGGDVQGEMVDRVLGGGMSLSPYFNSLLLASGVYPPVMQWIVEGVMMEG